MAFTANYRADLTVLEPISVGAPDATPGFAEITHSLFNKSTTLNSGTTPPATKVSAQVKALVAGAGTIDLTALPGVATIDATGLRVQLVKIQAKTTNGAGIAIQTGASNGYTLKGTGWKETLLPGQEFLFYGNGVAPVVSGTVKTIDLVGTGTDGLNVIIVVG